jgi:hypothetical protein
MVNLAVKQRNYFLMEHLNCFLKDWNQVPVETFLYFKNFDKLISLFDYVILYYYDYDYIIITIMIIIYIIIL